ncbi:hypothetical protein VNO77_39185 [Canavalia gladiata]|uniref:Uncharacterized protein n=1 Tax=Canavalia gladiata TaxID=3824 RepID=A0AAN9KCY7_CANGL
MALLSLDFAKEAKSPLPYSYFAIDSLDGIWVGSEASIERAIVQTGCRILAVCHNGSLEEGLEHYAGLLPRALLPSRSPIILTFTYACVWPPSKLTMQFVKKKRGGAIQSMYQRLWED